MEVKFGETGRARGLLQQNSGLVFSRKEIASAAEPAEGIVMEQLRHD